MAAIACLSLLAYSLCFIIKSLLVSWLFSDLRRRDNNKGTVDSSSEDCVSRPITTALYPYEVCVVYANNQ